MTFSVYQSKMQGFKFSDSVKATTDITEATKFGEVILTVIPTPFLDRVMASVADIVNDDQIICSCTKGILNDTLETPDAILRRVLPERLHSRSVLPITLIIITART